MAGSSASAFQVADIPPPQDDPPASDVPPAAAAVTSELHTGTEAAGDGSRREAGACRSSTSTTFASQLFWLADFVRRSLSRDLADRGAEDFGGVIADRAGRIKGDLDQAAQAKRNSEAAIADYEKALADARRGALKIGDDFRKTVQAEADAKNAAAAKQLAADIAEGRGAHRRDAHGRDGDASATSRAKRRPTSLQSSPAKRANAGDLDAAVRGALKRA